jgi:hypothetical protein
MGTKVFLNVYDLAPANDYLFLIGLGLHHSGVEILGSEYTFASGGGIFSMPPKEVPNAKFREQIEMGAFDGGQSELNKAISELRDVFGPDDYNIIRKNCNHFSAALCWKLLQRAIPGHVNRLADLGVCCSCLLPRKMLENAPVQDPNDPNYDPSQGSSGFLVRAPSNRSSIAATSTAAFSGSGLKLGGSSSSAEQQSLLHRWSASSSPQKKGQDDLTDRREKARKAALARLEKQQQQQQ